MSCACGPPPNRSLRIIVRHRTGPPRLLSVSYESRPPLSRVPDPMRPSPLTSVCVRFSRVRTDYRRFSLVRARSGYPIQRHRRRMVVSSATSIDFESSAISTVAVLRQPSTAIVSYYCRIIVIILSLFSSNCFTYHIEPQN